MKHLTNFEMMAMKSYDGFKIYKINTMASLDYTQKLF